MATNDRIDWTHQLIEQLDWHWQGQARPRLDGLTDDEYLWEPVANAWNVRPRDPNAAQPQPGSGELTVDFAMPAPTPPPVTTIAWRLAHITVGVFGTRVTNHFGGPPLDYFSYDYPGTADQALADLDTVYAAWLAGVRTLDETALATPVGESEGPWADHSMAELVLHINREAIHHLAEVALLRDLYAHR